MLYLRGSQGQALEISLLNKFLLTVIKLFSCFILVFADPQIRSEDFLISKVFEIYRVFSKRLSRVLHKLPRFLPKFIPIAT